MYQLREWKFNKQRIDKFYTNNKDNNNLNMRK